MLVSRDLRQNRYENSFSMSPMNRIQITEREASTRTYVCKTKRNGILTDLYVRNSSIRAYDAIRHHPGIVQGTQHYYDSDNAGSIVDLLFTITCTLASFSFSAATGASKVHNL